MSKITEKEIYLSPEGLEEKKKELERLTHVKRPEIIKSLQEARALGDLSENAEYDNAIREKANVDSQIEKIEYIIEHATIVTEHATNEVSIGSSVKLKYVDDGETETYKIVGSTEADPFENKISNESPIATAVLGHKKGDIVSVKSPNGEYQVKITEIG